MVGKGGQVLGPCSGAGRFVTRDTSAIRAYLLLVTADTSETIERVECDWSSYRQLQRSIMGCSWAPMIRGWLEAGAQPNPGEDSGSLENQLSRKGYRPLLFLDIGQ